MIFTAASGVRARAALAGLVMLAGFSGLRSSDRPVTRPVTLRAGVYPLARRPMPRPLRSLTFGRSPRPAPPGRWAPRLHDRLGTGASSNWAGYAVTGRGLTMAQGSWTVPAVTPSRPPSAAYSANWVGLDGYNSGTVEQLGTDSDVNAQGQPVYYAWFEMYPQAGYYITLPDDGYLAPGDPISARVQWASNGWFFLSMLNASPTHGWSFWTYQRLAGAALSSAEWITEAPWYDGVLPLADFGTTSYGNCQVGVSGSTGSALLYRSGLSALNFPFLDQWIASGKPFDAITMANHAGGIKAAPGAVSSATHGFSITWHSAE